MLDAVKMTEMTELDADSLHLVPEGANGFPALLAKAKAVVEETTGLVEPASKGEAEEIEETLTGDAEKSPGVPEGSTQIPASAKALPHWPANHHDRNTTSEASKPKHVDGGYSGKNPGPVGGGAAVSIPAASAAVHPAKSLATSIRAGAAKEQAYPHAKLAQFIDQIRARSEGQAIKEPWIVVQNGPGADAVPDDASYEQVARTIGEAAKAIDAIQERGATQDLAAAKNVLDGALAVAARLTFVGDDDMAKSGYQLSAFSTQALSTARDQIGSILAKKPTKPSTEAETIMLEMTKEQLEKEIASGSKKTLKKQRKEFKKAIKKITAAIKANGNSHGSTSNNKGEVSEGEIRGYAAAPRRADDIDVPGSGVTKTVDATATAPVAAAAVATPEKGVKKSKKDKGLKKQLAELTETVKKMANRPVVGGPHLTGTPAAGTASVSEGRQGEAVAKSTEDQVIDDLQKELDDLLKSKDPNAVNRVQDVSYRLSQKKLSQMHRRGEG